MQLIWIFSRHCSILELIKTVHIVNHRNFIWSLRMNLIESPISITFQHRSQAWPRNCSDMLTSAQQYHHHSHPQSANTMPVAASPCSTSSSSLGFQGSMSSSVSDLLNLSNSSFGESSMSSVRSSPKRHNEQQSSSVPRVRTIRLKRPSPSSANELGAAAATATTASVLQQPQSQLQSRNLLIGGGGGGSVTNSLELAGIIAGPSHSSLFGFSIRGGSEYRTGFFVSHVEPASEADVQGVQVGEDS